MKEVQFYNIIGIDPDNVINESFGRPEIIKELTEKRFFFSEHPEVTSEEVAEALNSGKLQEFLQKISGRNNIYVVENSIIVFDEDIKDVG